MYKKAVISLLFQSAASQCKNNLKKIMACESLASVDRRPLHQGKMSHHIKKHTQ